MVILIYAVNMFFRVLIYLILARALMSWFIRSSYGTAYTIYMKIIQITEPMLEPCRRLSSRFGLGGTIDFSPVLAIIALSVINSMIVKVIIMVFH